MPSVCRRVSLAATPLRVPLSPLVCAVQDVVLDKANKIVSTPAYMLGQNISEVAEGIEKSVNELVRMI